MKRRAFGLVLLVTWLGASGRVLGQGQWVSNPGLPPEFPPVFQFEDLPNKVRPQLFLNPSSIQVNLTGQPSVVEKESVEVWVLRKDGTVLMQASKSKPVGSFKPGTIVRSFYFEKLPQTETEIVGVVISMDGKLYVREIVSKAVAAAAAPVRVTVRVSH